MGAFLKKILDEAKGKSFEEAGKPGKPNSSSGIVNRISRYHDITGWAGDRGKSPLSLGGSLPHVGYSFVDLWWDSCRSLRRPYQNNEAETQRRSHVSPFLSRGKHSNGKSSGSFFLADDLP